ncbi:MAG: hypothetical protein LBS62_03640 [Clostridiales bacterium]|nr:hypothetical protein [Clostridiales bacterium]
MPTHYQNKWVQEIVKLQHDDGSWGYFHTLSSPTKKRPMTTEQALRRLRILGLTSADEPIRRAIAYIEKCITGELSIPDVSEVKPDWPLFLNTMFAAWLRIFLPQHELAVADAGKWSEIIETAFAGGSFAPPRYEESYRSTLLPKGKKIDYFKSFVNFYPLALLPNTLTKETEGRMLDYVLEYPSSVYYIPYPRKVRDLPAVFESLETSRYLAVLELLAEYSTAPEKLAFAVEWLNSSQDENGLWDLGAKANDGIYFPLSDSWRKAENRKKDCTKRVTSLLDKLL